MNFIYLTTNLVNGKQYVGSHSGDENDSYMGSGKILKFAISKYGKKNFHREILEACDPENNLILEEKYIQEYNTLQPDGYNISTTGGFQIFDLQLRKKLSNSKIGSKQSEKTKEKRRQSMIGKNTSPKTKEHKEKLRESMLGSIPWNKGIPWTDEARRKMSNSHIGKKLSEETKDKMSKFQKGRVKSSLERKNLSESKKGKKNPMYGKPAWNKGIKLKTK